jgi:electron transport complex protein RnfA
MDLIVLTISAMFINNILLVQYLGQCPFCGVSKKISSALGMGLAVLFVMTTASMLTWSVQNFVLVPLNLTYLQTLVFILLIATLVQFVELFLKKKATTLYRSLGIFLPLITTNCAVLGVAILCVRKGYDFPHTVVFALASALGFLMALLAMAGLRQRFEVSPIPKQLRGTAITLITAGIMALAFYAFEGIDTALKGMQ